MRHKSRLCLYRLCQVPPYQRSISISNDWAAHRNSLVNTDSERVPVGFWDRADRLAQTYQIFPVRNDRVHKGEPCECPPRWTTETTWSWMVLQTAITGTWDLGGIGSEKKCAQPFTDKKLWCRWCHKPHWMRSSLWMVSTFCEQISWLWRSSLYCLWGANKTITNDLSHTCTL